jgi:hypothetical protein
MRASMRTGSPSGRRPTNRHTAIRQLRSGLRRSLAQIGFAVARTTNALKALYVPAVVSASLRRPMRFQRLLAPYERTGDASREPFGACASSRSNRSCGSAQAPGPAGVARPRRSSSRIANRWGSDRLTRARDHVYYAIEETEIVVLAIWGAPRGRGPKLQLSIALGRRAVGGGGCSTTSTVPSRTS